MECILPVVGSTQLDSLRRLLIRLAELCRKRTLPTLNKILS